LSIFVTKSAGSIDGAYAPWIGASTEAGGSGETVGDGFETPAEEAQALAITPSTETTAITLDGEQDGRGFMWHPFPSPTLAGVIVKPWL